jgi:hypothetical protein
MVEAVAIFNRETSREVVEEEGPTTSRLRRTLQVSGEGEEVVLRILTLVLVSLLINRGRTLTKIVIALFKIRRLLLPRLKIHHLTQENDFSLKKKKMTSFSLSVNVLISWKKQRAILLILHRSEVKAIRNLVLLKLRKKSVQRRSTSMTRLALLKKVNSKKKLEKKVTTFMLKMKIHSLNSTTFSSMRRNKALAATIRITLFKLKWILLKIFAEEKENRLVKYLRWMTMERSSRNLRTKMVSNGLKNRKPG